jgi:PPM family protein phosphatase
MRNGATFSSIPLRSAGQQKVRVTDSQSQSEEKMRIVSSGRTNVGRKRSQNEDSFICSDDLRLYVVADGMGGHAAGEVASSTAVEAMYEFLKQPNIENEITWPPTTASLLAPIHKTLLAGAYVANRRIFELSHEHELYAGMGTTLTGAQIADSTAYIVHVGDSRLYLFRKDELRLLTQDHTWVAEQLQLNLITAEEARYHRLRNVITRALGNRLDVEIDAFTVNLEANDLLLICSDGLTSMLDDSEIEAILQSHDGRLDDAADHLVDQANEAGGDDNITLVLLKVEE